jgi:hypothetical protein
VVGFKPLTSLSDQNELSPGGASKEDVGFSETLYLLLQFSVRYHNHYVDDGNVTFSIMGKIKVTTGTFMR